jgi:histone H2A
MSAKNTNKSSRSKRAGLTFPVGRTHRQLKEGNFARRVGEGAAVYMAAVLEYTVAEVLELSGNSSKDAKRVRVTPRDIRLALGADDELGKLFERSLISNGGVMPHIPKELVKPKKSKGVSTEVV